MGFVEDVSHFSPKFSPRLPVSETCDLIFIFSFLPWNSMMDLSYVKIRTWFIIVVTEVEGDTLNSSSVKISAFIL